MEHIIEQERAVAVLQAVLGSGRIHHAFVFHGPPGVGKFTTALAFARVLLCHEPQRDLVGRLAPCDACPSCRLLKGGADAQAAAHPDLHVVTKELARYSDDRQVRERKLLTIPMAVLRSNLLEPVYRSPHLQHGKVFILDEAELLEERAQNLLLKTLEEPPANTYIILVTSNEEMLLPTIRSRCQRVSFVPLSDDAAAAWLESHSENLTAQERRWLIDFAGGSLGRLELALAYGLVNWAQTLIPALDAMGKSRLEAGLGTQMKQMIDDFANEWVKRHDNASKDAANRRGAALLFFLIGQHARRRLAERAEHAPRDDADSADGLLAPWLSVIDALRVAERDLACKVNLSLVTDHLVTQMYTALAGSPHAAAA